MGSDAWRAALEFSGGAARARISIKTLKGDCCVNCCVGLNIILWTYHPISIILEQAVLELASKFKQKSVSTVPGNKDIFDKSTQGTNW